MGLYFDLERDDVLVFDFGLDSHYGVHFFRCTVLMYTIDADNLKVLLIVLEEFFHLGEEFLFVRIILIVIRVFLTIG